MEKFCKFVEVGALLCFVFAACVVMLCAETVLTSLVNSLVDLQTLCFFNFVHFIHKDIDIEVCPHLEKETRGARDTRMRVANVDGLMTLFYDGSRELYNYELSQEWIIAYYMYVNDNWEDWEIS